LWGGDTYKLQFRDIEKRVDGRLQLRLQKEKNNQGGNQFTPVKDILLYLSKHPSECQSTDALFLECIRKQS
ncbi:13522_t:CDS:2, partial [Racocetra persica]